jgi:hypothetical protein
MLDNLICGLPRCLQSVLEGQRCSAVTLLYEQREREGWTLFRLEKWYKRSASDRSIDKETK